MKYLAIVLALIFSQVAFSQEKEDPINSFLITKKPTKDFQIINENCAISIAVSDEKTQKSEEDSNTAFDDYMFYQSIALEFLEKQHAKIVAPKARYLIFVMKGGKEIYLDTKKMGHKWILFSPNKKPQIIYAITMDDDYQKYFSTSGD